ncbi:lipopolysaccharide biosynthesis protein [Chryseolinea lacunae]|uniref:Lipopolysaccharide biosynthesis protein n=1 Tax=Chryseolinea lacunae TaxID=2801331 RepID=A0ABS1KPH0_9BACT|nr:lipopolysaccharide biosynthesis protein [Chryseolinea lacunae]
MISKGFIKSSLIYTVAGTLPMASGFILLPFYINQLSTELYGALSVYLVFSLLVQILVTFSFDTSVYIHFHELKADAQKLARFVSSAFVFMLLMGLGVGVLLTFTGDFVFRLVLSEKNVAFYPYGLVSVGAGIFQAIFKVHSSLLQSREKPEVFLLSNVLSFSLIATLTIIGLMLYPGSLIGPLVGRFLASLIPGLWALARIFREFGFHYDFSWLRSSFSFNAYTFIYQVQQWVINQFDRILMLFFLTLGDVGVYDFAIKCLIPVELLMNSLHSSFYPKVVSTLIAQKEKGSVPEINRYYHGLTAVVMLLVCGSILALPWGIHLFARKASYQQAIPYIPYIGLIYFFRTMRLFFSVPYGILKYSKPLPVIYLVISSVKVVGMIVLIRYLNVYGVIVASLLSAAIEIVLLGSNIRGMFAFRYNVFKIVLAPLIMFAFIVVLEPTLAKDYPFITHAFYLVCCGGLLWWAYRKELPLINPLRRNL